MYDFLTDLDEYFCEKYANYDKLCVLSGYKMPVMQASKLDEFGRTYAYTLPANTMRLALQEKKEELLAELKTKLADTTFSFSFQPLGFFSRVKNRLSRYGFVKNFRLMLQKYAVSESAAGAAVTVSEEIWKGICKGKFLPTKNLLFSLGIALHFSMEDVSALCALCGYEFDYALPKDVVVSYLLTNKVYNPDMVEKALQAYKVRNLFIA